MLRLPLLAAAAAFVVATPAHAVVLDPTALLSVSTGTSGGNDAPLALDAPTGGEAITPDGRYVAFVDFSTNLTTATDTNSGYDVFWRDTKTGQTKLVSVNAAGTAAGAGDSERPTISDDGRYVAFDSTALNLVSGGTTKGDPSQPDVYLRDMAAGTTTLVSRSTASANTGGNHRSIGAVISGNGRYVVFSGRASDLESPSIVSGTLNWFHILVRDLQTGVTSFVDVNPAGSEVSRSAPGGTEVGPNSLYAITADGRYIAFQSAGYNLITGYTSPNSGADNVFRRDQQTATTVLASPSTAGPTAGAGGSNGFAPLQISADGRYIAFEGDGGDLVPGMSAGATHVFQRDLTAATTTLLDPAIGGGASDGLSYSPRMSADGRYVMFWAGADDVLAGDANNHADLVRWDRTTGARIAVDVAAGTSTVANGGAAYGTGALSADGSRAVFASDATNLVASYTGAGFQVYLRDFGAATTQLLSSIPGSSTAAAGSPSTNVWLSANGRRATWTSAATDLVTGFVSLNGPTADFFTRAQTPDPDPAPDPDPQTPAGTPPASTPPSTPPAATPPATEPNPLVPPAAHPGPRGHGVTRRGTPRRDVLVGTRFADRLLGGAGDDSLKGKAGRDVLSGGPGNDRIDAADGVRDTVNCGPGRHDRATVDALDAIKGCEKVTVRPSRR